MKSEFGLLLIPEESWPFLFYPLHTITLIFSPRTLRSLYVFSVSHPDLVTFPLCTPPLRLCVHFLTSRNAILFRPLSFLTDGYSSPRGVHAVEISALSRPKSSYRSTLFPFSPSCLSDRIPPGGGEGGRGCVSRKRKLHREGGDATARTTTRDDEGEGFFLEIEGEQ